MTALYVQVLLTLIAIVNVLYLITCEKCQLQYVGGTVQKLNERLNWHKSGFRDSSKYGHFKNFSELFSKGLCKGAK